jgi:hypothetical protein
MKSLGGGGGQASWAKFTTIGVEANSTDLLSLNVSKAEQVTMDKLKLGGKYLD